jgi:1-acyl-sn-glycerol-3-phosphate acyltransferase
MSPQLPSINVHILGWFRWFVRYYLRKHFHAVAVQRRELQSASIRADDALVVYANHAAWWDPLAAIHLAEVLFPGFDMYAPIDADALAKYPMFARMGFFGVRPHSQSSAQNFLKISHAILERPGSSLWLTPEGRFADVRDTSAELMPGLGHLAWKLSRQNAARNLASGGAIATGPQRVWFLPVALEYPFWEERQPELLVWFGRPIEVTSLAGSTKQQCAEQVTAGLRLAQQALAQASVARDTSAFEVLASGSRGTFFLYDWWRTLRGVIGSGRSQRGHGEKLNS